MHFSDTAPRLEAMGRRQSAILAFCARALGTTSTSMTTDLMIFIAICAVLAILAVLTIVLPMWRARATASAIDTDMDIYRDQLAEVDRDLARGVLDEAEAERTRTEISRRLLTADAQARAATSEAPRGLSRAVAGIIGAGLLGATGWLYGSIGAPGYGDIPRAERIAIGEERRATRPGQLEAEAMIPIADALEQFDEETQDLIRARRAATFENPTDPRAFSILSQTEAAIGQFHRAARAQEKVISLKGEDATEADLERLLDLLVAGTQGYVSPEAETIALRMLQDNPDNIPALYYAGLLYAQNDRPDRAFSLWRRVVETGTPGTLHHDFAVNQIEQVAAQLGRDYTVPERRGPSADDIEAAQDMAPEDRQAMIEGMVAQLADRLADEGGPPQDWARLISALAVLGDTETARTVLAEAEVVFGGDVQAVNILRRAAEDAGLSE